MEFLIILVILVAGAGIYFWRKRQKESGSAGRERPESHSGPGASTAPPADPDPGKERPRPAPKPAPDPKPKPEPDPAPRPEPDPEPDPEPGPADNPPSTAELTRDLRILFHSNNPAEELSTLIGSELPGTFNSTVFGIRRDHYAALRFRADHLELGDMGSIVFEETTHIPYGTLLVTISRSPGEFGPGAIARRLVHPGGVHNAIRWIYGMEKGSRIPLPAGELYLNLVPVKTMPENGKPQWWNPDGADRAGALIAGKRDS